MEDSIQKIREKVQNNGGRNTPVRDAILECLFESAAPVSVPQLIHTLGTKGFRPNKTTVYRQLSTLVNYDAIEMVKLDADVQLFEIKKGHHHHFVCDNCDDVIDIDSPEVESALHAFERELGKRNLRVTKHEFALYGLCNQCN